MINYIFWIAAAVIFSIIEILTFNMITIWFVSGSVASLIFSILGFSFNVQIWVFVIVSVLSLIVTKPIVSKKISKQKQYTNIERIIGTTAIVTDDITQEKFAGKVMVSGQEWSAVTKDGSIKKSGEKVIIKSIEGVKLIVE